MSNKRFHEEFMIEAVKQVVDRSYTVAVVAKRLDVTTHSLYAWGKKFGANLAEHKAKAKESHELRRLKEEL